ncbi:hypothetical protein Z043_119318 [Scleropages formosus]|uniref:Uncharacterized protein n=1 Tax=Scleropages formosus TaxID=113540 RepID=A0A0P7UST6_SCLFO|nr:hypothetical protein Z043_119318 [Scleropages formosus]
MCAGASQSLPTPQTYSPSAGAPDAASHCRSRPNTSCPVPIKVCPRSPPSETRTRTSSSCSSYSYAEDGSGGSPCSLPQFELSSSPCSGATRCLATDQQEPGAMGADAVLGRVRPKIKCEQPYGTNSSDESGSLSEGDSESCHVQDQGAEAAPSSWYERRVGTEPFAAASRRSTRSEQPDKQRHDIMCNYCLCRICLAS